MEDLEFSDEFCRFIQTAITSVAAAELLLLFHQRAGESITADEAVAKLGPGITIADASKYLELFQSRGLLASFADNRYQYLPENELAAQVDRLAQAYSQRPVTLFRMIYAFRDSKIKSFADAFRLRKH
ncbi:MAG TPA: hypothetical protein VJT81_05855 [Burkholderiales bacterium]|nr:hypothetical protein [Burkholderiales bacterium]